MSEVTDKNIKQFIAEYEKAKAAGETMFNFNGHDVLIGYAKYVIEYFKMKGYPK